jgi:hypothetical protein
VIIKKDKMPNANTKKTMVMELGLGTSKKGSHGAAWKQGK